MYDIMDKERSPRLLTYIIGKHRKWELLQIVCVFLREQFICSKNIGKPGSLVRRLGLCSKEQPGNCLRGDRGGSRAAAQRGKSSDGAGTCCGAEAGQAGQGRHEAVSAYYAPGAVLGTGS